MAKLTEQQKEEHALARRRKQALAAEADHQRHEAKRREWQEKGIYLTRDEMRAGEPCRSCGLPLIDGLGDWPPLAQMTDAQRAERDAASAAYQARHADCRGMRWSMSGSRAQHCGFCCPPHPMSEQQARHITGIFDSAISRRSSRDLDAWRLVLTCDHVVEGTQHHTNRSWSSRVVDCPDCGEHRGVVNSERLPNPEREEHQQHTCTKRTATERELAKLRRESAKLQERIEELEREIAGAP